jgi:HK97 family phage major capsid protein
MPTFSNVAQAIDAIGTAFDQFKQTNDQRLEAVRTGNEAKAKELDEKLSRIESELRELHTVKDRLEDWESRMRSPGRIDGTHAHDPQYTKSFVNWLRKRCNSPGDESIMTDIQRKDVTVGSLPGGGYALPKEIAAQVEALELKISPVRRLVKVVTVGTTDFHQLVNIRGTTSGWVGESQSRAATDTPKLRDVVPTFGELYCYPQVSEWSLDDLSFNVTDWLVQNIADEFAYQEGVAVLTGNGTNKPTGMLNAAPVTTADWASPLRAAAAYQYIADTNSPIAITSDKLIDLVYTLNSAYRGNGTYVMNSATTGAIRKLKSTTNEYLWTPSMMAGQPDRLNGYPIQTWENLDDIGSAKYPVAFGDFSRGYLLTDRIGTRITRDDVTNIGYIRFYVRRREGGIVLNNDAIKWIKTS